MQYNKHSFFREIFSIVFVVHVLVLIILFVSDTGKFHQERFAINTDVLQPTIVFMPLKKRIEQKPATKAAVSKTGKDRKVMSYHEYEKKVAAQNNTLVPAIQPKKEQPVPVKKPEIVKKPVIAPKPAVKKASTTLKTEVKPKIVPEKKIQPTIKSQEKIPVAPIKKIEIIKPQEKKQEPVVKPVVIEEQKNLAVVQQTEPKKDTVVDQIVPERKEEPVDVVEHQDQQEDLENISFVGTHDLEMIEIQEQIRAQVAQHYKPPVGISKKAICELTVVVGQHGKAEKVAIKKGSGSLANDMCARAALLKITFPKEVVGKEIIVELGQ